MNEEIHVNKILKTYLDENKVNLSELARQTQMSYNVLYNVLNGRTALRADDFIKICCALGLTGDELLTYPTERSEK